MILCDTKIKLFLFRPTMGQGGADRVTLTLLHRLDRSVFEPHLVLVKQDGVLLGEVPEDVPVHVLGASSLWTAWKPLRTLLRAERPDVLCSTCSGANMPAALAHRLAGWSGRLVLSERNVLIHGPLTVSRLVQLAVKRLLYPGADLVTSVSQGVKDDLVRKLRLNSASIEVVYNPVVSEDMRVLAGEPVAHPWFAADVPIVLGVGRLVRQKDFPTLIRAFARVRADRPARLVILGEGPEELRLRDLARTLGVGDDVWLAGYDKNPFRYMARAALFVLSSRQEGLPGALIQAMACGVAVVSTDCPAGPSEIVTSGVDGYLVPVGAVDAMADCMTYLLDHPDERRHIGERARVAADRFREAPMLAAWERVLAGERLESAVS